MAKHEETARVPVRATHEFAVIPAGETEARKVAQRTLGQEEAMQLLGAFALEQPQEVARRLMAQERRRKHG